MLLVVICCGAMHVIAGDKVPNRKKGGADMILSSSVFGEGTLIPSAFTCDGADISPPLEWKGAPKEVLSFALICDDPDAPIGDWVHWVVYNIPADVKGLSQKMPPTESLADGTRQGINDFRKTGYGGPCPPGGVHRYFFKLYALDTELPVDAGMTKKKLLDAIKGHVIADAVLMGKYQRK